MIRLVFALVLASLFMMPEPAQAANSIVMVQSSVGSQDGNLRYGVRFVDQWTGSRFVHGKCRVGKRCIVVKIDKTRAKGTAYASWKGSKRERVTIKVNPGRGSGYMRRLFAHEVGHAMFLPHSKVRTNLMWPTLHKKDGSLVTFRFTDPQKTVLRRH